LLGQRHAVDLQGVFRRIELVEIEPAHLLEKVEPVERILQALEPLQIQFDQTLVAIPVHVPGLEDPHDPIRLVAHGEHLLERLHCEVVFGMTLQDRLERIDRLSGLVECILVE